MQKTPENVYTVTAINRMAKFLLEESFPDIWVQGEISNYHLHGSGHRYFSLKDDKAQLSCAMWRSFGAGLKFEPKDGLKVLINGSLTVYEVGGRYQMSVKKIIPAGMGELELAFRQLQEKLEKEGLFDPAHKKELPSYPMRLGVITSATGAAIHDIIRVVRRRNPRLDIVLWPSEVQGETAPLQLVNALKEMNNYREVDVIIIGRGGGSLEDLWAFNDERVVRAVFDSRIPVISAVGHEVDVTLTDLVADYRAATPSMAAEIAAWPLADVRSQLAGLLRDMDDTVRESWREKKRDWQALATAPVMVRPETMLENRYQKLDGQVRLLHLLSERRFDNFRKAAGLAVSRLEALSPLKVLARGFSVTRRTDSHEVVRSIDEIAAGQSLETIVKDGRIISTVTDSIKK